MFTRANAINQQNTNKDQPRVFPRASLAVTSASDSAPVKLAVDSIINAAEARGQRNMWSETTPGSILLLPNGQATAAVADIWNVVHDAETGVITLELDLVHDPRTMSEFAVHGKQVLDVDAAHYHFNTGPSVTVDAQGLLRQLQASDFKLEGAVMAQRHVTGDLGLGL